MPTPGRDRDVTDYFSDLAEGYAATRSTGPPSSAARSASYFPRADPLKARLEAHLERHFRAHAQDGIVILDQRTELTLSEPK